MAIALLPPQSGAGGMGVAFLLFLVLIVGYLALLPMVSLAYPAVVLERLGPIAALKRGYELQRPGFWRVPSSCNDGACARVRATPAHRPAGQASRCPSSEASGSSHSRWCPR